jgi:hypothetical protein
MTKNQKNISITAGVLFVVFTFSCFYEPTFPPSRRPSHLSFMLEEWAMIGVVWAVFFFLADVPKAK